MSAGLKCVFAEVALRYERVNRILTLGLDCRWRRAAARTAAAAGGRRWLDVCSGTGDMARRLLRWAPPGVRLTAVDFSRPMLSRAKARDEDRRIDFSLAEAKDLPFADGAFDVLTVSFATRNLNLSVPALEAAFREFHRVLRPGGTFVNVETSQPPHALVRAGFRLYVRLLVRPLGRLVAGRAGRAGYAYLAATIPRFHAAEDLAAILTRAGFRRVAFRRLLFGAAAVHASVR